MFVLPDREKIARIIYEHWPTTYETLQLTTESTRRYERVAGADTWEETCGGDPKRADDCRACADKIIEAMNTPGHPGDNP